MKLKYEDLKIGMKVKIPITKTIRGLDINSFNKEIKLKEYKKHYLFITYIDDTNTEVRLSIFKDKQSLDYGYFSFDDLELYEEEEFILPEKWFTLYKNIDILRKVNQYSKCGHFASNICSLDLKGFYNTNKHGNNHFIGGIVTKNDLLFDGYIEINYEQFLKYVLKEEIKEELKINITPEMFSLDTIKAKLYKYYDKDDVNDIVKTITND